MISGLMDRERDNYRTGLGSIPHLEWILFRVFQDSSDQSSYKNNSTTVCGLFVPVLKGWDSVVSRKYATFG